MFLFSIHCNNTNEIKSKKVLLKDISISCHLFISLKILNIIAKAALWLKYKLILYVLEILWLIFLQFRDWKLEKYVVKSTKIFLYLYIIGPNPKYKFWYAGMYISEISIDPCNFEIKNLKSTWWWSQSGKVQMWYSFGYNNYFINHI